LSPILPLKIVGLAHPQPQAFEAFGLGALGLEVGVGSGVFAKRLGVSVGIDQSIRSNVLACRTRRARGDLNPRPHPGQGRYPLTYGLRASAIQTTAPPG